jgi:hypothetical protein
LFELGLQHHIIAQCCKARTVCHGASSPAQWQWEEMQSLFRLPPPSCSDKTLRIGCCWIPFTITLLSADGGCHLYEHTKNCYQSLKKLHKFKNFNSLRQCMWEMIKEDKNNQFSKPEEQILPVQITKIYRRSMLLQKASNF